MKKYLSISLVIACLGLASGASAAGPTSAQFNALKAQVASLKTSVTNLKTTSANLKTRVATLENHVGGLEFCLAYYVPTSEFGGYSSFPVGSEVSAFSYDDVRDASLLPGRLSCRLYRGGFCGSPERGGRLPSLAAPARGGRREASLGGTDGVRSCNDAPTAAATDMAGAAPAA